MVGRARGVARLAAVAMGDRKADMLVRRASVVSVYTGEVLRGQDVAVSGDRIAYVGPDGSHAEGPRTRVIDAAGRFVAPGLADPHVHVDQLVTPAELAGRSLLCGTTSLFSDPIDVVSVAGYRGFREFVRMSEGLPARFFHVVPGGLPVDPGFGRARPLSPREERAALRHPAVLGLGEVFSWTRVTSGDPDTARAIERMLEAGCAINGHTAGASGRKLAAYASSGILSCHEPVDAAQALERLRLGLWVMLREGSIRRDLAAMLPGLLDAGVGLDRLMMCTDGLVPADLDRHGHMDHCVREAIRLGAGAADAYSMASRNCFEYYGMGRDIGGVAPGRLADMLVIDELESARPRHVIVGGRVVVADGRLAARVPARRPAPWTGRTVRLGRLSARDFEVRAPGGAAVANTIVLRTEIVTGLGSAELAVRGGAARADAGRDVWKVAALDRVGGTGARAVGFLEGFGADVGAFASTWSFHENDLVVLGTDDSDMALAANAVAGSRGGMAVARGGRIVAHAPLEVAGIMSAAPFAEAAAAFASVTGSLADAGCPLDRPHLVPLFLPFLALPSVRILHGGIVDVRARRYLPALQGGRAPAAPRRPRRAPGR